METYREMTQGPAFFKMGVPATETFPATLFARIRAQAVRAEASAHPLYPDPRGELELRREIAGYLAVARGITCLPSQAELGLSLRPVLESLVEWGAHHAKELDEAHRLLPCDGVVQSRTA